MQHNIEELETKWSGNRKMQLKIKQFEYFQTLKLLWKLCSHIESCYNVKGQRKTKITVKMKERIYVQTRKKEI